MNVQTVDRRIKARPATPGVELGVGSEKIGPAGGAGVEPVGVVVPILPGECSFSPRMTRHLILLRRESLPPLGVCQNHGRELDDLSVSTE